MVAPGAYPTLYLPGLTLLALGSGGGGGVRLSFGTGTTLLDDMQLIRVDIYVELTPDAPLHPFGPLLHLKRIASG